MSPVEVRLIQMALVDRGFDINVDSEMGPQTKQAIASFAAAFGDDDEWPADSSASLNAYYGAPAQPYPHLVRIDLPYEMVLAWDTRKTVSRISCHRRVADSLQKILACIETNLGRSWILEHGLHLYGGCYNHRRMRGGSSWSRHAYGIAIDLNPDDNGLMQPWDEKKIGFPGYATMPIEAIEIFESHGWKSYARSIGRDAMHFQATK